MCRQINNLKSEQPNNQHHRYKAGYYRQYPDAKDDDEKNSLDRREKTVRNPILSSQTIGNLRFDPTSNAKHDSHRSCSE
ncbi:hypothetical protein KEM48_011020 [Puccinia striiformis f. sp. tritici PST-130]|nr:hypothetical protein H4Q26_011708 [Puccinia striiformis f. sp. tritici PST-130]KAI9629174.1 hypothetical protein KEM48_011020 [Puccinia striiformis f. sp. tritici PST-130]